MNRDSKQGESRKIRTETNESSDNALSGSNSENALQAQLEEQRQIALYHQQIREQYARTASRNAPPVCPVIVTAFFPSFQQQTVPRTSLNYVFVFFLG